ncbi:MAG TPA: hypothetical protein VFO62_10425 [Candidatus Binatia bacterium]|nr:hypothetical protein [Candidatus Binatia bacterium]
MSYSQIIAVASKAKTLAISATRPSGASDGVDITSWRIDVNGGYAPTTAALLIEGSQALEVESPTGGLDGPELWGYRLNKWWRAGYLNNGLDIVIVGASQGFAAEISIIGVFERLAIAGTPSIGSATATMIPVQEWQVP